MNDSSTYDHDYHNAIYRETSQALNIIPPLGLLICLGGLGGNGLVLGLLGLSVKWGDFTVFIFHLSVADFLYLSSQTVVFMQMILTIFHSIWFDPIYVIALTYISYTVGLCVLTAISIWRCLSVLCPIWCRLHAPRHAPATVCTLIWVLSISVSVPHFLVCWIPKFRDLHSCDMYILTGCVFFCVLFSVTEMCTLIVLVKVRCGTQRRPPLKLYTTVLLTVLFVLCAFPLGIYMFFLRYTQRHYLQHILLLLACVNSSANPLVYYFVGRMGRHGRGENFWEIFQKTLGEESAPKRECSSEASTVEEGGGTQSGPLQ